MPPGVMLSLEGKVAVVTGGSRGIGAAGVKIFHRAGARVLFSYEQAEAEAQRVQNDCGGPGMCRAMRAELSTPESARALVKEAVQNFGKLDIVVGNHGIWPPEDTPVDLMTDQQWRRTLAI